MQVDELAGRGRRDDAIEWVGGRACGVVVVACADGGAGCGGVSGGGEGSGGIVVWGRREVPLHVDECRHVICGVYLWDVILVLVR